jgi:hypothetical protein
MEVDINSPVWSVIILLCCGLAFTLYCVVYILRMAYMEMQDGSNDTTKQEELLQLPSSGDQQSG